MTTDDVLSSVTCLSDKYPNAYCDFYPSGAPCIFKSGPDWPVRKGPQAQGIIREPRPVNHHPIDNNTWLSIGERIYHKLDSICVEWTSINPLAYANAGEAQPFCALILSIGVKPHSLFYDDAVAAAAVVKEILAEAGFPEVEVAFVESVATRLAGSGPKLHSFDPLLDDIPELRKPFTPTLGLPIAHLKYPHFEGTGTLYFRLGKDNKRTAMLTCAHVARPNPIQPNPIQPNPIFPNITMTYKSTSQPRDEFVALGNMGYRNAIEAMKSTMTSKLYLIEVWNRVLNRLGEPVEGESLKVTQKRKGQHELIADANRKIHEIQNLHDEVTKHRKTPEQRVIGFVLHSEKIGVDVQPCGYTEDWALIEIYQDKINWSTFQGNKVYVGMFSFYILFSISSSSYIFFFALVVFRSCLVIGFC